MPQGLTLRQFFWVIFWVNTGDIMTLLYCHKLLALDGCHEPSTHFLEYRHFQNIEDTTIRELILRKRVVFSLDMAILPVASISLVIARS